MPLSRSLGCKRCLLRLPLLLDTFGRGGFGGDEAAAAKSGAVQRDSMQMRQPLFSGCVESEASSSRSRGPRPNKITRALFNMLGADASRAREKAGSNREGKRPHGLVCAFSLSIVSVICRPTTRIYSRSMKLQLPLLILCVKTRDISTYESYSGGHLPQSNPSTANSPRVN